MDTVRDDDDDTTGYNFRFKTPLCSLDASTIDICLSVFPWADFRSTKGAIKLHVGFKHAGCHLQKHEKYYRTLDLPLTRIKISLNSLLADYVFRRLLLNAGWLMGGNAVAAAAGLVAMVLTARILGPAGFGVLVLMTTYVSSVDRLLNFQTWQGFIKYGAEAVESCDDIKLRQLTKLYTVIDVGTAVLSAVLAMVFANLAAGLLGFSSDEGRWLMLYSLVIAFNFIGVPTGALRLFNRFRLLALHQVLIKFVNLLGVLVVWRVDAGIAGFLLSLAISQLVGNLFLIIFSWRALANNGVHSVWRVRIRGIGKKAPDIWRFAFYTNIESSVKIFREADVFIVKAILSSEAVGIYRVARRFAEVLHMFIDPFFQAIYPEFTKLYAALDRRRFIQLILRGSTMVGSPILLIWVAFVVFGEWVIVKLLGGGYSEAYSVASLCMFGTVIWAFSAPLPGANIALGHFRDNFWIHLSAAIIYMITLSVFSQMFGIFGAGISYLLFSVVWGSIIILTVIFRLKQWQPSEGKQIHV